MVFRWQDINVTSHLLLITSTVQYCQHPHCPGELCGRLGANLVLLMLLAGLQARRELPSIEAQANYHCLIVLLSYNLVRSRQFFVLSIASEA